MFRLWFSTLALVAGLTITATGMQADWTQWRGPSRDGRAAAPSASWPKELKQQWQVAVGVGHSTPVVSEGRIYVFARQQEEEVLLCLDALTGKEFWRSAQPIAYEMNPAATGHGKGPKSTPVIVNNSVFTFGITGVLSCHDKATGRLKWRKEFSKQYPQTSPLYGTAMSPIADGNLLITHVGGHDKGALTAFDMQTGTVKWANDFDGPAYSSPIIVTLAGVRQVVTFTQKNFVGVDASNGQLLWNIPAKSEYDTNSVTAVTYKDMLIFAAEGKGLTAIRLEKRDNKITPQEVWNNRDNMLYLSSPVLESNLLFGFSVMKKGQFFAVDADTGKTLWQGPGRTGENAAIINCGGKDLLLLTNDAKLIVLPINKKEYAPAAQYTISDSETWAHPVVLGNRILIKDQTSLRSFAIQ
jgi:outer membrane protein assembly factor BamB